MRKGSYSEGKKYGFIFVKKIRPITKIEEVIFNGLNKDKKIVKRYVSDIKKLGISCSNVYYVSSKLLIQEYIKGISVDEYINSNISDSEKIKIIKSILELFKLTLNSTNIRIDWNLNNFILSNNKIILVDYIPSLYVDKLDSINTDITKDLYDLYNNLDIQLCGIIGYSMVPFLEYDKDIFKNIYKEIIDYSNKIYIINRKKRHIFIERILLIEEYLDSDMKKEEFISRFKDLSLSKKMKSNLEMGN